MLRRFFNLFQYQVERFLLGGAKNHLLFVAIVIGLVSLLAGLAVRQLDPQAGSLPEATWWAFLRLTDPGYLGDDQGTWRRLVSTFVTIAGYVLFMGALVAILTQWLNQNIRRLESGLTPISRNGHILILGWTDRTATVVRELLTAGGRLDRFLKFKNRKRVHIVILAPQVSSQLTVELKEELEDYWDPSLVTFRTGTPLKLEDLERVDFLHASAIILPASSQSGAERELADASTVKTLLTISEYTRENEFPNPQIVTEIIDPRRTPIAEAACSHVEVVEGESIVCRLMAQNIRNPGLSFMYHEFLRNEIGSSIFLRELAEPNGVWDDVSKAYPNSIPVGLFRGKSERIVFCPKPSFALKPKDKLIIIARNPNAAPLTLPSVPGEFALTPIPDPRPLQHRVSSRSLLIFGWSEKFVPLCEELASYRDESFVIDVLSSIPIEERKSTTASVEGEMIKIRHLLGDYTIPDDLATLDLESYDNLVFLAGDREGSIEESDARTILGHWLVQSLLKKLPRVPGILVELVDPDNEALFEKGSAEVITSPSIVSHMLGNVALRPDLNRVFEELFDSEDAEFSFYPSQQLGLDTVLFAEVVTAFRKQGKVPVGWIRRNGRYRPEVIINPPENHRVACAENLEFILLSRD